MAEILLFEDSPSLGRIVARYLRDAGHGVSVFGDGAPSRDRAVLERADVVVTDLSMPGTDGRAVLSNIGTLRPDLPTILMTGVERFADPVLDTAYGYLRKPFPEEDLLAMIDAALRDVEDNCGEDGAASDNGFHPSTIGTVGRYGAESMTPMSFCGPLPPESRFGRIGAWLRRWLPRGDGGS